MISVGLIRIIAGILAVVILGIIIWRRKRRSKRCPYASAKTPPPEHIDDVGQR